MSVRKFMPWLAVAFVAILALAVTSVGAAKPTATAAPSATAKAAGAPLKIALITDIGGLDDRSFNFLANKGLQDAKAKLGVEGRVYISKSDRDYVPNLVAAATRYKADLVIAVGFLMAEQTAVVAKRYPNSKFAIIDFSAPSLKGKPKNVRGLLFKEQEAGYLVGIAAAAVSKTKVVGSVGGLKIPPVDRFIAGYQYAAKRSGVTTTLNDYSADFGDQAKCKEIALNQIAQDADVVFAVAGACGLGALSAAKQRGKWGIGVDADQWYIGPHILTSATKKVDVAVFNTIATVKSRTFKGGVNKIFTVKNNGVGYGRLSTRAPKSVAAKLTKAVADIKAGRVSIPATVK